MKNTRELGQAAEKIAENHYRRRGFAVLSRNYRLKCGELDLVMQKGDLLLFVEVKGRSRCWEQHAWLPDWRRKVIRLRRAIGVYLQAHPEVRYEELRLEVAFVTQGRVTARFERI
jgi:putative endonuclease